MNIEKTMPKRVSAPNIHVSNLVMRTDWKLLKKQKTWLAAQQGKEADGLLHFLDSIQDMLVDKFGFDENKIFQFPKEKQ